ncbi:Peptidyl-prolyl cis-trans isomerase E [Micractinium conductrix]|uniref:Peptidyl-prolyl cis-trans isomerase E n=1 Tax=Micractinium conductrix TaxID=554055 RepID=A0A2P6VCF3_9CHLO|nr:Peptidyl-prolyl cis-trans isomerase E [Micractinium conductrix]|eukprot:PSC71773.1 Peptidyl-prolyl cis-trans isomerase E [Micractinium conductrix]
MQTTVVAKGGKGSNPKTALYVGGLEATVNEAALHSAFLPFGDIKEVSLPLDHATGTHRGFGFVEFEAAEDAATAVDNMHNSELYGRVLRVNYAQPNKIKGGDKGFASQAVWADADDWYEKHIAEEELEKLADQQAKATKLAADEAIVKGVAAPAGAS